LSVKRNNLNSIKQTYEALKASIENPTVKEKITNVHVKKHIDYITNVKTYVITGDVFVQRQYYTTEKKNNKRILLPRIKMKEIPITKTIKAASKEDAEKLFVEEATEQLTLHYGDDYEGEQEPDTLVVATSKVDHVSISSSNQLSRGASAANTGMKNVTFCKYAFIPSEDKYLENEGTCVIDNFVGIYGQHIKKLTREYFEELVNQFMGATHNPLDALGETGCDYDIKEQGVTPLCLTEICKELNISMYAYDFTNNCFLKHVTKNRNYPALVYYAVNGHMYLIGDRKVAMSLIKRAVNKETKINSIVFENTYEVKNRFDEKIFYDNVPVEELYKCKDGVNIIDVDSLNKYVEEYIKHYNTIPKDIKSDRLKITEFYDLIHNVIIAVDPNDTRLCNY
jgi:hypothetical protein